MILYVDGTGFCDQAESFAEQMKTEYKQIFFFKVYIPLSDDILEEADAKKLCPYFKFFRKAKVHSQINF